MITEIPKPDRFDFEQKILQCWGVVEDIETLYKQFDRSKLSEDEIQNALLGLMTIYEFKFQQMFDLFSKLVEQGKIK